MTTLEPSDYAATLEDLKRRVRDARFTAQRRVNTELILLYQSIGQTLLERTESEAWGSGVITQLANDLRAEFPEMKGFSPSNLKYMRLFARGWPDRDAIGQQPAGQLPWGHLMLLLDKLDTLELRDWYAAAAVRHGWTRDVLRHQIATAFHDRAAAAGSNFAQALERTDSELAQQITKDPYILDFLALDGDASERVLEQGLVDRIIDTLRELGAGFAFVGRQVHFDVDGDDFYIDLLFFHTEQLRYVVVELKTGKFKPEHSGQLGFYVALVDERLRRPQHAHTVGILLCSDKNASVVRYALASSQAPIAVSSYDLLPAAAKAALPSEDELTRAVKGSRDG